MGAIDPVAMKFALAPFIVFAVIIGTLIYCKNRR